MIITPSKKEKKPSYFSRFCREITLLNLTEEEEKKARECLMQTQKLRRAKVRKDKNGKNK